MAGARAARARPAPAVLEVVLGGELRVGGVAAAPRRHAAPSTHHPALLRRCHAAPSPRPGGFPRVFSRHHGVGRPWPPLFRRGDLDGHGFILWTGPPNGLADGASALESFRLTGPIYFVARKKAKARVGLSSSAGGRRHGGGMEAARWPGRASCGPSKRGRRGRRGPATAGGQPGPWAGLGLGRGQGPGPQQSASRAAARRDDLHSRTYAM